MMSLRTNLMNCNFLKYFSVIHAVSTSFGNQLIESKHNRVSQLLIQGQLMYISIDVSKEC